MSTGVTVNTTLTVQVSQVFADAEVQELLSELAQVDESSQESWRMAAALATNALDSGEKLRILVGTILAGIIAQALHGFAQYAEDCELASLKVAFTETPAKLDPPEDAQALVIDKRKP